MKKYSMIKLKLLFGVLLFFVCLNSSYSQATFPSNESDSLIKEKLRFIETSFQNMQSNAKLWKYGWYAGFSTLAISQGTIGITTDNKELQKGMALGVVTSVIGIGGLVTKPLVSIKAYKTLQNLPENTIEERKLKLEMAEKLLKKSAEREINGKNWKSHATAGAINLTAGLVTWLGFKKSIWDGLTTFAISTAIAELQIITQPKKSAKAFADYNNKYNLSDAKLGFHKKQKLNWFVGISPSGFRLNISL
ncbi:MAG: hypothetical protein ACOYLE_11480 [Bacteroidales bacterium]